MLAQFRSGKECVLITCNHQQMPLNSYSELNSGSQLFISLSWNWQCTKNFEMKVAFAYSSFLLLFLFPHSSCSTSGSFKLLPKTGSFLEYMLQFHNDCFSYRNCLITRWSYKTINVLIYEWHAFVWMLILIELPHSVCSTRSHVFMFLAF